MSNLLQQLKIVEGYIQAINDEMKFAPTSKLDALEERERVLQSNKKELEEKIEKQKAK